MLCPYIVDSKVSSTNVFSDITGNETTAITSPDNVSQDRAAELQYYHDILTENFHFFAEFLKVPSGYL